MVWVLTLAGPTDREQAFTGEEAIASLTFPTLMLTPTQIFAAGQPNLGGA